MAEQLPLPEFDSPLLSRTKSDKSIMDYPFFALNRTGQRKRPLTYNDGQVKVEIKPKGTGIATVYDKDLILYVAGIAWEKINRGEEPGRTFTFSAYDFARATGRPKNKDSYERILKMLERLQGTQIKTNIEHGGKGVGGYFSWLDSAYASYLAERTGNEPQFIRVTICEWLYRAICQGKVLTYDPGYFDLGPMERRIYDIARSHCGRQSYWPIKLPKLREKVGYEGELRRFKYELNQIIERQPLPAYRLRTINDKEDPYARQLHAAGFRMKPSGKATNQDVVVLFEFTGPRARTAAEYREMLS
jgi:plasmid replication initiation protein